MRFDLGSGTHCFHDSTFFCGGRTILRLRLTARALGFKANFRGPFKVMCALFRLLDPFVFMMVPFWWGTVSFLYLGNVEGYQDLKRLWGALKIDARLGSGSGPHLFIIVSFWLGPYSFLN